MVENDDVDGNLFELLFLNYIWWDVVMEKFVLGVMEIWEFINFIFDVYLMYVYFI